MFGTIRACWVSTANPVCGSDRRGLCSRVQEAGVTHTRCVGLAKELLGSEHPQIANIHPVSQAALPTVGLRVPRELLLVSQTESRYGASLSSESRAPFL